MCQKNEARAVIKNVDEAILEYYYVFAKRIKPLPPEPQLSPFGNPLKGRKNVKLVFVTARTGLAIYAL